MKCNCWVLPHATNKNKAKLLTFPQGTWELSENQLLGQKQKNRVNEIERCKGKIIAIVKAINEPYFGGSSAQLDVEYTCSRCGSHWSYDLPNEYNISDFLTNYVENL